MLFFFFKKTFSPCPGEWISGATCMYIVDYLVTQYGQNEEVRESHDSMNSKLIHISFIILTLSIPACSTSTILVPHCGVLWCTWLVQRFPSGRLRVRSRRSATFLHYRPLSLSSVFACLATDVKAGPPPLDLSFWSFSTFLHHGIEE